MSAHHPTWEAAGIRFSIWLIGARPFSPDWLVVKKHLQLKSYFKIAGKEPGTVKGVGLSYGLATSLRNRKTMATQLVAHMKIRSGGCIKVKGMIEVDAKSFAINLGQNESELIFHFNPRFNSQGDVRTIICNSKTCGEWGKEVRESAFPFQQGEEFKLFVCFDAQAILVKMQNGGELLFPNRLKIDTAEYFSIVGDLRIKTVGFD